MTKQQIKKIIEKARKDAIKQHKKIKVLEYQIDFDEYVLDVAFSMN